MKLIIDIGNTRAKLLVFNKEGIVEKVYGDSQTLSALDDLLARYTFEKGILSSVAKLGEEAERRLKALHFPLTRLSSATPLPVNIRVRLFGTTQCEPLPPTMGADRIAALVGAITLLPATPLLIIDAGTCITYEVIDQEGFYVGGNIAPGIEMRLRAMHEHTALLPLVDSRGRVPALGQDTDTAMRCGVLHGVQYEIEGYVRQWSQLIPGLQVFLAGADDLSFSEDMKAAIRREDNLVPYGLNAILDGIES